MVEVRQKMATCFKRSGARTTALSVPDPAAGHHSPTPLLETPGHSQTSLGQSLWDHRSFLLGSCVHKVLFVPSKNLFPRSCRSSIIKSHWPPNQISWRFSAPLPDPQVGESVVGPRTFLTVQEFIWYNCSAVCGSSARQLYGGVNGNLLQEGLCHTQVCCTQSPCPCSRPLLTLPL